MTEARGKDEIGRIVVLVRGLMEKGGFYWCYVAVKPSLYERFQEASTKKYNIQNFVKDGYGEVVVSGEGREPPQEVTAKVAELFGVTVESLFKDAQPLESLDAKLKEMSAASEG